MRFVPKPEKKKKQDDFTGKKKIFFHFFLSIFSHLSILNESFKHSVAG